MHQPYTEQRRNLASFIHSLCTCSMLCTGPVLRLSVDAGWEMSGAPVCPANFLAMYIQEPTTLWAQGHLCSQIRDLRPLPPSAVKYTSSPGYGCRVVVSRRSWVSGQARSRPGQQGGTCTKGFLPCCQNHCCMTKFALTLRMGGYSESQREFAGLMPGTQGPSRQLPSALLFCGVC